MASGRLVYLGLGSNLGEREAHLRRALARTVEATRPLVRQAGRLPGGVADLGLRAESAVVVALAERLLAKLARQDPLAMRVKMGPAGLALAVASGLLRAVLGRRP